MFFYQKYLSKLTKSPLHLKKSLNHWKSIVWKTGKKWCAKTRFQTLTNLSVYFNVPFGCWVDNSFQFVGIHQIYHADTKKSHGQTQQANKNMHFENRNGSILKCQLWLCFLLVKCQETFQKLCWLRWCPVCKTALVAHFTKEAILTYIYKAHWKKIITKRSHWCRTALPIAQKTNRIWWTLSFLKTCFFDCFLKHIYAVQREKTLKTHQIVVKSLFPNLCSFALLLDFTHRKSIFALLFNSIEFNP